MTPSQKKLLISLAPLGLAVVIIVVMALVMSRDTQRLLVRGGDEAPKIEFTWTPAGAVSLRDMKADLRITDDYGLDFTTYKMHLVEIDRTIDLPIPGLIGKEYSQPISFSLIAADPKLVGRKSLTVEIEIADDRGQKTELTRVIELK